MMVVLGVRCRRSGLFVLSLRLFHCLGGAEMSMCAIKFDLQLITPPDQTLLLQSITLRNSKRGGLFLKGSIGLVLIRNRLVMALLRPVQSGQSRFMLRKPLGRVDKHLLVAVHFVDFATQGLNFMFQGSQVGQQRTCRCGTVRISVCGRA